MHLTYNDLRRTKPGTVQRPGQSLSERAFKHDVELDDEFFHSAPTSFFVVNDHIPRVLRELITEAEGCRKMNHLVGASACTRKAIYELLHLENAQGAHYDEKINNLREKFPRINDYYFEALRKIKDMTSEHVHEQSWVIWKSKDLSMFLESLEVLLHEMYVAPAIEEERLRMLKDKHGELTQKNSLTNITPA